MSGGTVLCTDTCTDRLVVMAPTPTRTIRVDEPLWHAAKTTAERRGETVTGVITEALRRYVRRNQ